MSKAVSQLQKDEKVILKAKVNIWAAMSRIIFAVVMLTLAIIVLACKESWYDTMLQNATNNAKTVSEAEAVLDMIEARDTYLAIYTWAAVLLILIGVLPLVFKVISLMGTDITVTNKRIIGKTGVIKIKTTNIHIDCVDNIIINESFWGKVFRFYSITVKGSGEGSGIIYSGISNANQLKNAINGAIEQHAEDARKAREAAMTSIDSEEGEGDIQ